MVEDYESRCEPPDLQTPSDRLSAVAVLRELLRGITHDAIM